MRAYLEASLVVALLITDPQTTRAAFAVLDAWAARATQRVDIAPSDARAADGFMRRLDLMLRTPDALHIAIAMRVGAALATFDARMADAARAPGVEVVEA